MWVADGQEAAWDCYLRCLQSRSRSLLLKIENLYLLNNLCLHRPIDAKFRIVVAFSKRQLGITTQGYVVKVKVTVAKNRKSVSAL